MGCRPAPAYGSSVTPRADVSKSAFVTVHPAFLDLLSQAAMVAKSGTTVLITGESGTGKEVLARYIHAHSAQADRPCVAVNCAALPHDVIDNELFGHEREAFTGAHSKKAGCFEMANGGTLFLDEIAEMAPQVQAKLLRAVETKRFRRLGGAEEIEVDVRIISATNRDIKDALKSGHLREDVYYRLGVVELYLPPLRDRVSDIPLLLDHFARTLDGRSGRPAKTFAPETLEILTAYPWPGNVRELRNVVEALLITCPHDIVAPKCLPERLHRDHAFRTAISIPAGSTIHAAERLMIDYTLKSTGGNKSRAAQILGVSRKYLYDRLREYGDDSAGHPEEVTDNVRHDTSAPEQATAPPQGRAALKSSDIR